jgi:hypothetical protein
MEPKGDNIEKLKKMFKNARLNSKLPLPTAGKSWASIVSPPAPPKEYDMWTAPDPGDKFRKYIAQLEENEKSKQVAKASNLNPMAAAWVPRSNSAAAGGGKRKNKRRSMKARSRANMKTKRAGRR